MTALPILYSYRRCPYAMRARMALTIADIKVEIREISLREKPAQLLLASPKGTVPVLILQNGSVIDESLDIMRWAFTQNPLNTSYQLCSLHADEQRLGEALILSNDNAFKRALDGYKYPERNLQINGSDAIQQSQLAYRQQCEAFLQNLEALLQKNIYLVKSTPSIADIAIFPFIRQFAAVNPYWFESATYPKVKTWLDLWLNSTLFERVMIKQPTYFG